MGVTSAQARHLEESLTGEIQERAFLGYQAPRTPRRTRRQGIALIIPDEEGSSEIEGMVALGLEQHPGLRLPTSAPIGPAVRAVVDRVDSPTRLLGVGEHATVDLAEVCGRHLPASDPCLVRDHDDAVARLTEQTKRF